MPYRRHVSETLETKTYLVFSLVVRDEANATTFGGGWATVRKPFTDAQLEQALDAAVTAIVRRGNAAFPRDKARIRAEAVAAGLVETGAGRQVQELARGTNNADWPSLIRGRA